MVYIPKINFKTGINPSTLSRFPTNGQYSGTQKLMLAQTRIFGTKISGNYSSGIKPFRLVRPYRFMGDQLALQLHNISKTFPFFRNDREDTYYRARKEKRAQAKLKKQAKKKKK